MCLETTTHIRVTKQVIASICDKSIHKPHAPEISALQQIYNSYWEINKIIIYNMIK